MCIFILVYALNISKTNALYSVPHLWEDKWEEGGEKD